jgi:hypothetical protein
MKPNYSNEEAWLQYANESRYGSLHKHAFDAGWKAGYKQSAWSEAKFCQRCGKRLNSITDIHTCTPPETK